MKINQNDIFKVEPTEYNGWEYEHVKITFPANNVSTNNMWVVDAIPCQLNGETHPDMTYGTPILIEDFVKKVYCGKYNRYLN